MSLIHKEVSNTHKSWNKYDHFSYGVVQFRFSFYPHFDP